VYGTHHIVRPKPWQTAKPTRRGDQGKRKQNRQDTVAAAAQKALIMRHKKTGQNTAHNSNHNTPGMQAGTVPSAVGASPSQFARELSWWGCKKSNDWDCCARTKAAPQSFFPVGTLKRARFGLLPRRPQKGDDRD